MQFLTYNGNGPFTGAYIQDSAPTGVSYIEVDDADYANWVNLSYQSGAIVATPAAAPSSAQLQAAITTAVQAQLDATAVAHGYDDVLSACSYAAQPAGSPFQAEGLAFLTWRSAVWTQAYATLAAVEAGTAQLPTPAQAVASMPVFVDPT